MVMTTCMMVYDDSRAILQFSRWVMIDCVKSLPL
jgi:hypothetical protein